MKIDRSKCIIYSYFNNEQKQIDEVTYKYSFIILPDKIIELLLHEKKILVAYNMYELEDLMGYERYRNVWCYSIEGELLWRIQQDAKEEKYCDPYSGIFIEKDTDLLKVSGKHSLIFDLDIETGKISNPDYRK